jgi:hypothetical protein
VLTLHILLCWFWCPEIGTSSIDWAQPEDGDRVQSPKPCFEIKDLAMDNVQKVSNPNKHNNRRKNL